MRSNNQPVHVHCWIDNKSAVTWLGKQQFRNPSGQELNRVLASAQLQFGLHVSTEHLRGTSNFLADLGSRAWTGHMLETWTNRVYSWCSQDIPTEYRKIYKTNLSTCNDTRYRTLPASAISTRGTSGANSATGVELLLATTKRPGPTILTANCFRG
ncbi:hypothetical protein ON010_g11994 [Phytophthora cinnamomi]|nr:hypothetical protein ON010_g11994 [Phytophthora cinnamomi]